MSTRLTQDIQARYRGIARLFASFVKGSVQKKLETDLQRLRTLVESGPGQATP